MKKLLSELLFFLIEIVIILLYIIPCGSIQTGYQDVLVGEEMCGEGLGCSFGMFACINVQCYVHFHWVENPI